MSDETGVHKDKSADAHRDHGGDAALTMVGTLMEERRKYESWIAALEARRATTPQRVFTRVHDDYSDRLDAVIDQLKEHTEGLRDELASLTSRLTSLEEEQQQRRDERAEAELRAHVGELSAEAWNEVAAEADRSLEALTSKHVELEHERSRTRELLTEAERPPTPRGGAAVAEAVRPPEQVAAPVAPPSAPSVAPPSAALAPAPAPAAVPAAVAAAAPRPSVAEARPAEAADVSAAASDVREADVTPPPTQRADKSRLSGETAGGFDELAFLSSVVNTPTGTDVPAPADRPDERTRRDSFAQRASEEDIVNLASDPGTMLEGTPPARSASPLAMNVSGNIPIVIKDKTAEAAKSLKCGECGAMNYPTEWYCERCGAELASL
jgi:hypothetical protein